MRMENKVSIIVPVYNVERYIENCVRSLLNQDYRNIEVILVDDGSPDGCGAIIDQLNIEDNRIIVVHQNNKGVSSARNAGLSIATGYYVTFVDGDDWVESNYVSYFVKLMKESGCNIAMNKNNYSDVRAISNDNQYVVSSDKVTEWIYLGDIFVAVWNKMYKKSIIEKYNIRFNEDIWYGEGMLFNVEILQYVNEVIIGEKSVYHQTFNPDSAMRKFNLKSNFCGIKSLELQKLAWKKHNKDVERAWKYHRYCFNRSIIDGLIRSNMVSENRKLYSNCVSNIRKDIMIPLRIERSVKQKIIWCGYVISPRFMAIRSAIKFKHAARL